MRALLLAVIVIVGTAGIVLPCSYLYFASKLPTLESEYDLETLIRANIEGERIAAKSGKMDDLHTTIDWPRPDSQKLPYNLVALFLSELGCPHFFQTPRETNRQAAWRWLNAFTLQRAVGGAEGKCEWILSNRIALDARLPDGPPLDIAALRIRNFLTRDQLVAYAMEAAPVAEAVFGPEDASKHLFKRELKDLSLSQLAELILALPPVDSYDDILRCKNESFIRKARDIVLHHLDSTGLVPSDQIVLAQKQPLLCKRDI